MSQESEIFVFNAHSEDDTFRFGAALAGALPPGTNVALIGTLGAGKTRLVQAVAKALGVPDDVATSPTFVLVNQYHGRRTIVHIDAYRLRDDDEFLDLGVDEIFDSSAIVFLEWADRFTELLPPESLEIRIDPIGETARRFSVTATSSRLDRTIEDLRRNCSGD